MSRYISKPHGIVIGSDNIFFYRDETGMKDFPAIAWAKDYEFDQVDSLNVRVRTPAQQILMQEREATDAEIAKIRKHQDPFFCEYHKERIVEPSAWIQKWLDTNTPGWGFPPAHERRYRRHDESFFFTKRSHALLFAKMLDDRLKGIKIPTR